MAEESSKDGYFHSKIWPRLRHFIAGSASGVALVLVGHPFDTVKVHFLPSSLRFLSLLFDQEMISSLDVDLHLLIFKVRLQTDGMKGRFTGPINCLLVTVKQEGVSIQSSYHIDLRIIKHIITDQRKICAHPTLILSNILSTC